MSDERFSECMVCKDVHVIRDGLCLHDNCRAQLLADPTRLLGLLRELQTFRDRESYVDGLLLCLESGAPDDVIEHEMQSVRFEDDECTQPWFPETP